MPTLFICLAGAADGAVVPRRSVLGNETALVLAEERTRRKDPLDNLNYYTGGWNISNEHYFTVRASLFLPPLLTVFVTDTTRSIFVVEQFSFIY